MDYMDKLLIKNTTKEQREAIVKEALGCSGSGCENCSGCGVFGAIDPYVMYQPYIDGIKEIREINMEYKVKYNIH
jgi:hypothetical protein